MSEPMVVLCQARRKSPLFLQNRLPFDVSGRTQLRDFSVMPGDFYRLHDFGDVFVGNPRFLGETGQQAVRTLLGERRVPGIDCKAIGGGWVKDRTSGGRGVSLGKRTSRVNDCDAIGVRWVKNDCAGRAGDLGKAHVPACAGQPGEMGKAHVPACAGRAGAH